MTNQEAIELLEGLADAASFAVREATWAQAFLTDGGEATWDAVKAISHRATDLALLAHKVERFEEMFEEIVP